MSARLAVTLLALPLLGAAPAPGATPEFTPVALAKACEGRDGWADAAPPAHLFGNTWYVGTCGIAVLLVTSPRGHVLIDTGLAKSAPDVIANIERLGFHPRDVRWIVASHEHGDHVEGMAELKRLTGARVAALPAAARTLASGEPQADDPQAAHLPKMPPVPVERVLADGARVRVGPLVLTARATPAHSPGSTSWTWQSCEGKRCQTMTYADSANTISATGYRFTDHPDRVAQARAGIAAIRALPCGLLITPHPSASDLFGRMASGRLANPGACAAYADAATGRFDARLAKEAAGQ